jgi:hypothetical protein
MESKGSITYREEPATGLTLGQLYLVYALFLSDPF